MKIKKQLSAIAVAAALVVGALGGAQAAQADAISGGVLTISPMSGNAANAVFLNSIATNQTAPAGFRALSGTFIFQGGVNRGSIADARTPGNVPIEYGTTGLDAGANVDLNRIISPTNNYVSNKRLNQIAGLTTGQIEIRLYFFAGATPNFVTDKYFSLTLDYNATTGAWSVPVPALASTVSLSATATGTDVALEATVKKQDGTTATDAVGNVLFKEGATTVATVAVANGIASTTLTGVANGPHTYTAEFVPTSVYSGSTSAGSTVYVGGQTMPAVITVAVPDNQGALTLTGVPAAVNMGTAVLNGQTLDATGTVTAVVTDSRQLDKPAWSLTGQVTDFASGARVLDGKYLGWTPSITSGPSNSTAGAAVAPAPTSANGIKSIAQFANGAPSAQSDVTNASAALLLKAPRDTVAGTYTATLTVTLI